MDFGQFFCFRNGHLEPVVGSAETEVQLAVADSWLVEDGRAREIERHFERFGNWVLELNPEYKDRLEAFFEAVRKSIPLTGRWFPRLEYHREAPEHENLYFRLREAPEQLGPMTLWTLPESDPRANSSVKGPDLSLGMQMRRNAKMHGADEAVLLNSDGYVAEGALCSLVWWRGDVLCAPDDSISWLPSVTREIVLDIARTAGYEVQFERAKPADLVGLEIWGLSSLQGIRVVEGWVDLGAPVGKAVHFDTFNKRLKLQSRSIA